MTTPRRKKVETVDLADDLRPVDTVEFTPGPAAPAPPPTLIHDLGQTLYEAETRIAAERNFMQGHQHPAYADLGSSTQTWHEERARAVAVKALEHVALVLERDPEIPSQGATAQEIMAELRRALEGELWRWQ